MRTLQLTTPHMKGDDVKRLQVALLKKNYYNAVVDGEYGPHTAQAVYRAKYWLGYPKPDHVAGAILLAYLRGKKKLSVRYNVLAKRRKTLKARRPMRVKMFTEMIKHVGEKERSGHNDIWVTDWYGVVGPWCAMAVTWCGVKVGSRAFKRGSHYAYVPYIVADARAGRNNLTLTKNPQQGDIVCYDWNHDGIADHVGLFDRWENRTLGTFVAVEGNTAVGNNSNGGQFMHRGLPGDRRAIDQVIAFVHVGK